MLTKVGLPRSMPCCYVQTAGSQQRLPLAFAALVVIEAMAMVRYEFFSLVEKRTTAWAHRGSQAG